MVAKAAPAKKEAFVYLNVFVIKIAQLESMAVSVKKMTVEVRSVPASCSTKSVTLSCAKIAFPKINAAITK